ncbi:MAG: high light inducible protein [Phormidesmis priestleyi]|uniref:High light inducible protein n=1 Tax=Phormidesmis priestleyi TaxID=268141 RepID=A0A2W4XX01_9CYAN|nr:MAG: high light inducible protein [Phormidesmis priestleyi]
MSETPGGKIGFTEFAETWNGRLAMIGFVAAMVTEFVSGKGILEQLGLM